MIEATLARDPKVIDEELSDLRRYLEGVPAELKAGGVFAVYERRAAELSHELIMSELLRFYQEVPAEFMKAAVSAEASYKAVQDTLGCLESGYQRSARRYVRWAQLLQSAVLLLVATSGSAILAVSFTTRTGWLATPDAAPIAALAFGLAVVILPVAIWTWSSFRLKRALRYQRLADQLAVLRNTILHSFGPTGEILDPADYYQANREQIEELLAHIRKEVSEEKSGITHLLAKQP